MNEWDKKKRGQGIRCRLQMRNNTDEQFRDKNIQNVVVGAGAEDGRQRGTADLERDKRQHLNCVDARKRVKPEEFYS